MQLPEIYGTMEATALPVGTFQKCTFFYEGMLYGEGEFQMLL